VERSVTEFVPELNEISRNQGCVPIWRVLGGRKLLFGSLASHMSGIGRDCENPFVKCRKIRLDAWFAIKMTVQIYLCFPFPWTEHGLPQLDPASIPTCGRSEHGAETCTREGLKIHIGEKSKARKMLTNSIEYSKVSYIIIQYFDRTLHLYTRTPHSAS